LPVEDIETVQSVHDGDTFRLTNGQSVRLLGIDTPEVPPTSVPAQCYGLKARDLVRTVLPPGAQVSLYTDPRQGPTDRYNRLLRYVEIPSANIEDLSAYLLEAGAAQVFTQYPVARTPHYSQLQEDAQTHRRGLWGIC
jgi:micrococcal nuclease